MGLRRGFKTEENDIAARCGRSSASRPSTRSTRGLAQHLEIPVTAIKLEPALHQPLCPIASTGVDSDPSEAAVAPCRVRLPAGRPDGRSCLAHHPPIPVTEVLGAIHSRSYVLPAIQREFEWS